MHQNSDYDDDYDDNDEPLFSKWSVMLLAITALTTGIFSWLGFEWFNHNIIDVIYPVDYHKQLWLLVFVESMYAIMTVGMVGWVAYRLYQYSYESLPSYLGFHRPNWGYLLLWTVIFVSIHALGWANQMNDVHIRLSEMILSYGIWATLISVVVIAPICEELIFRGVLWRATLDAFGSERTALIVSSGLFAIAHLRFDVGSLIFYFVSGCVLLSARLKGGTLAFGIFLHFLHNFALTLETLIIMTQ